MHSILITQQNSLFRIKRAKSESTCSKQNSTPFHSQTAPTSNDHHADGEDLLVVRLGGDVAKADAGHAGHRKVQRGNVHRRAVRAALQL